MISIPVPPTKKPNPVSSLAKQRLFSVVHVAKSSLRKEESANGVFQVKSWGKKEICNRSSGSGRRICGTGV